MAAALAAVTLGPGCAGVAQPGARGAETGSRGVASAATAEPAGTLPGDAQGAARAPLAWAAFEPSIFAHARAERRFVVLDGAAEWCHWCHVMEATTWHDPTVRSLLDAHFLAAKVDIDARPDIEARYAAYGWPATVIFTPDGQELGKYRGYIAPEAFADILRAVITSGGAGGKAETGGPAATSTGSGPLPEEEIAWIGRSTELDLADYYDDDAGGWGRAQKAPLAMDNAWALARARSGDDDMRRKVLFTLDAQRALLDPVWGGVYQYSAGGDWRHPHFEKLMTFQAGALENYAEAYALTKDATWLATARALRGYIDRFLTSPEGGFYASQDADLNAHDPGARFVAGHDFYALDDAHRRALGVPRVDAHEYGKENGLAIAAYVALGEASHDPGALDAAARAARRILATHATDRGGIAHDAGAGAPLLHLADNAAFGLALMRLHEATGDAAWLRGATGIAEFLLRDLEDPDAGGFFSATKDPDAVGVFAVRQKPFEENVTALRFLARLARATRDPKYPPVIARTLRAIATPDAIRERGRMIGDFLQALDETRGVRATR